MCARDASSRRAASVGLLIEMRVVRMLREYRDLFTGALTGFVAGYTTANTKVRFNTFGGMMTGNTVLLGISIQQGDWPRVGVYSSLVLNFALGTVFALAMLQKLPSLRAQVGSARRVLPPCVCTHVTQPSVGGYDAAMLTRVLLRLAATLPRHLLHGIHRRRRARPPRRWAPRIVQRTRRVLFSKFFLIYGQNGVLHMVERGWRGLNKCFR